MAYDENLAGRIRDILDPALSVEEKKMFGGLCYMVNDKMCFGILKDEIMVRIDPEKYEEALKKKGCRPMDFTGRPMKGYVYVSKEGIKTENQLRSWMELALAYNKMAKASKKRKKPVAR